jgi:putative ABC transport system permease protein
VTRLRDAAATLASSSEDLTSATARLSTSLRKASKATGSSSQDRKDLTKALTPRTEFPGPDTVSRVFVKLHDGASPGAAQASIEGLRADVEYRSSAELTAAIQDQIDTFRLINDIMRVISLLVAAITVFILTYVELTNRRRQIGIERAIGIRGSAIVSTYVLKSVISALVGVGLGLIAFRAAIVPFVERHPFHFPNGDVVLVADPSTTQQNVAMLLVVAVVAAFVPTANTVRMRILDAIWGR